MVKNYMEILADQNLKEILTDPAYAGICTCEKCNDDIMAYALNHVAPFYITCKKGEVFAEYSNLDVQNHADVVTALTKAIDIVAKNCNHNQ